MAHQTSSDPNVFILPDLGEGVQEAEIISWKVKVGQTVDELQIIAEMETDKALVEVPSPRAGTIKTLHGEAGEIINVGNPLVTYEGGGESSAASSPEPKAAPQEPKAEREDAGTVVGQVGGDLAGVTSAPGKVLATPAVRRLARDMGVEINTIAGTGIGGRVTEKDIKAAASGTAPAAPTTRPTTPAPSAPPQITFAPVAPAPSGAATAAPAQQTQLAPGADIARIPFRGVRRTIANRLRESLDKATHFYVMDEADVTDLDALRKNLGAASGEKVSFLPFIASALSRALTGQFGVMNATVDDDNEEIVQHRSVHMGIAADTDSGLMVPVIRDCDRLGVLEIQRQISAIAAAARTRSIPREQLMGSTFTISNVGSHAGRYATPIINYPEVGILAVGKARESMVIKNGWFRIGKTLPLSLGCDHRVVDGATAALALAELIRLLQDPEQLLTPAR